MGPNEGKLLVGQLARLIQDVIRDADLTDVVQEGNVVVLLRRLVIITQLPGKHFRILGHTEGVALCISVLQVDNFGKSLDDFAGKYLVPLLPLDQAVHLVGAAGADVKTHPQQAAADQKDDADHSDADDIAGHVILHALHGKIGTDIADTFLAGIKDGLIAG